MKSTYVAGVVTASLFFAAVALDARPAAANDGLKEIYERGTIRMGIRTDKKPFGYRNPSGEIAGMDADLGKMFAERLGVKLEFVPVSNSNRMQFLEQGKVDFFSAQMSDTNERRKIVGVIHPTPYSIGVNAMTRKADKVRKWEDLRGKTACSIQGSWFIKDIDQRWGIKTLAFKQGTEAYAAYEDGRCQARIGDDVEIYANLQDDPVRYKDHEMALESWGFIPVAMAVPVDQQKKALGLAVAGFMYDMHASGKLLEIWKAAGTLPDSPWMNDQFAFMKDWMLKQQ